MKIQGTFGIEVNLVSDGGHIIGTLAVGFTIGDDKIARLFKLDEFVTELL